jgi:dTDP-4-dehydrorhamnose reductase
MKVLITGAAGMLGADVANEARRAGHDVAALARAELDITQQAAITAVIDRVRPDVVVNCAAFTDVDGAESQWPSAEAVNGHSAGHLAAAARSAGAWIVHISSDYVFDGRKREPYVESDPVAPLSAYGRSKLAGETAVARAAPERHTIVRSSWLFGAGGPCFPKTIRRLAAEREQLTVVDDQVGCPTFTGHLASRLIDVYQRRVAGVVHVAAAGACSWFEFAQEIVRRSGLSCEVVPGTTEALARPAPRPAYSVLGTERPDVAPRLPDWQAGLDDFLSLTAAVPS